MSSDVVRIVSIMQPELLMVASQQQSEQPQQGDGQVTLATAASSRGPLGLPSFLFVKDALLFLQLPLIVGRVLGQVLLWGSLQQHVRSAGLAQAMLDKLVELSNRFKYIVHVVFVEKGLCPDHECLLFQGCRQGPFSLPVAHRRLQWWY